MDRSHFRLGFPVLMEIPGENGEKQEVKTS
jgi:hypothetical protein